MVETHADLKVATYDPAADKFPDPVHIILTAQHCAAHLHVKPTDKEDRTMAHELRSQLVILALATL